MDAELVDVVRTSAIYELQVPGLAPYRAGCKQRGGNPVSGWCAAARARGWAGAGVESAGAEGEPRTTPYRSLGAGWVVEDVVGPEDGKGGETEDEPALGGGRLVNEVGHALPGVRGWRRVFVAAVRDNDAPVTGARVGLLQRGGPHWRSSRLRTSWSALLDRGRPPVERGGARSGAGGERQQSCNATGRFASPPSRGAAGDAGSRHCLGGRGQTLVPKHAREPAATSARGCGCSPRVGARPCGPRGLCSATATSARSADAPFLGPASPFLANRAMCG